MKDTLTDKLYHYYKTKEILPTYAKFASGEDLRRYRNHRESFFRDKLRLPPHMFRGAQLVEFGPDCGENSLVFATWGADVTLVEPNPNSWPIIEAYFKRFQLTDRLVSRSTADLEQFETDARFRFIDAEGFIYTIKPDSIWIGLFQRILDDDGFAVISYMESFGSLLEFVLKVIFSFAGGGKGRDSVEIAWRLFEGKWNSIPHTRSFESWVMDVLENPFVRLQHCFEAGAMYEMLSSSDFDIYASWPNYLELANVYWHKKEISREERKRDDLEFILRSRLSFVFGGKLLVCCEPDKGLRSIGNALRELLGTVDQLIDRQDAEDLNRCRSLFDTIRSFLHEDRRNVLASEQCRAETLELLQSLDHVFSLLSANDIEGLIAFCNTDPAFIRSWGMPHHFAVLRKSNTL